jgi:hypothetical protein
MNLFNQGFRKGLNGNYRLTGHNLSLFGNQQMTSVTKPLVNVSRYGKLVSGTGTFFGALRLISG